MNKVYVSSFISGLIFAIGLGVAGMMNPDKVQGWLDITGKWDPSLAMVMAGGVLVTFLTYPLILKRKAPVFEKSFAIPSNNKVDKKLLTGAVLFGVGWGIGGLCPGPAIANLSTLNPGIIVFVASMLIGFYLHQVVTSLKRNNPGAVVEMDECTVD